MPPPVLIQEDIDALLKMTSVVLPQEQAGRPILQGLLVPVEEYMFAVAAACAVVDDKLINLCLSAHISQLLATLRTAQANQDRLGSPSG